MKETLPTAKLGMRDELFNAYMRDINKKVMTREEEQAAFKRLADGDESAYNEIIEANLLFVVNQAREYATAKNLMDLIEVGNIGLLEAIETFDYKLNNKFISHAVWYIKRQLVNYILHKEGMIRRSNNAKTLGKISKIKRDLFQREERIPTIEEIKEEFKLRHNLEIKDERDLYDITLNSIDAAGFGDDNESTFAETSMFTDHTASYNDYEKESAVDYTKALVAELFKGMKERDVTIMKMYFGIDCYREYTIDEIAEELGLTKERVRQIKNECQTKMKKYYKKALANVG